MSTRITTYAGLGLLEIGLGWFVLTRRASARDAFRDFAGERPHSARAILRDVAIGLAMWCAWFALDALLWRAPAAPVERAMDQRELTALRTAKRKLAARQWAFGLAWFFTAASLSVEMNVSGGAIRNVHFLLLTQPAYLWWSPVLAAVCWTVYATLRRQSQV